MVLKRKVKSFKYLFKKSDKVITKVGDKTFEIGKNYLEEIIDYNFHNITYKHVKVINVDY